MGKYQRYDKQYNGRTTPFAVRRKRRWTAAEEQRLLKTWCHVAASPAARVHVAKVLGRTYVACAKRHAYLHNLRQSWVGCRADGSRGRS